MSNTKVSEVDFLGLSLGYLIKIQAIMIMKMTQVAVAMDEDKGEMTARNWYRALGYWRGQEMRRGHQAMGYPINMESITRFWDNASTYHIKDQFTSSGEHSPSNARVCMTEEECYHAHIFRANNFWRFGHIMCDEIHQAITESYHPDGVVVIPTNQMKKGDDRCLFHWVLPENATDPEVFVEKGDPFYLNLWDNSTPLADAKSSILRTLRINGAYIYFMLKEMFSLFGKSEGEVAARRAIRSAGWMRGQLLKEFYETYGNGRSAIAFLNDFDHPISCFGFVDLQEEGEHVKIQIKSCPFDDVWLNFDGRKLGRIYCEEIYKAILLEYLPGSAFKLNKSRSQGDSVCEFDINL